MLHKQYSVYDSKAEIYLPPFCFPTHGASLRAFKETCNDGQSSIAKHPADYTLFYIGEWDDNIGIQETVTHINLGNGLDQVDNQELPFPQQAQENVVNALSLNKG